MKYSEAINKALANILKNNQNAFIIGLGAPDPSGIFGTTLGLQKIFGKNRVMDSPTSENALTGICIGAAAGGMIPIMTHHRVEFVLLALEQIFNQASKWNFIFDKQEMPLIIRLIIGRGWGQGPQHSQALHSIFSHFPGLQVYVPTFPNDVYDLLIKASKTKKPSIFLEHRWLYNIKQEKKIKSNRCNGMPKIIKKGKDLTLVSISYATIQSMQVIKILENNGLSIEHIDLISTRPINYKTIVNSVKKTKKIVVIDIGWIPFSTSSEIIAFLNDNLNIKINSLRIGNADHPTPASPSLAKKYYPSIFDMTKKILKFMNIEFRNLKEEKDYIVDKPDESFTGPF